MSEYRKRIFLKLFEALADEIADLPPEKGRILIDDLTTAFINRRKIFKK